jgi:hypothetical protein
MSKLADKVKAVFNEDFSFEPDAELTPKSERVAQNKSVSEKIEDDGNNLGDVIDNELDSMDEESKEELEKLIKKKDNVRVKTASLKVILN